MLAVPDLLITSRLFAEETYPDSIRDVLITVLYGGQRDEYDTHVVSTVLHSAAISGVAF